jgi:hypothetical protein
MESKNEMAVSEARASTRFERLLGGADNFHNATGAL